MEPDFGTDRPDADVAVAEKPQIAMQALIFVALAEGLVVFGFITALMILGRLPVS